MKQPETMTLSLFDLISKSDLEAAIAARLVNVRDDGSSLRILNYSDAALYTPSAWENPAVRQCRGIIVDHDWNVIARPWSKFFNHGQAEAGDLDLTAPVEVTDKMDGSLGIVHLNRGGIPHVASRGSFESDQALHATAVLQARYADRLTNLDLLTPLVEIIYPANRIVCDYGDLDDLVLLGGVHIKSGTYYGPEAAGIACGWTGPLTATCPYLTLHEALLAPPRPGKEGMCVRYTHHNHIVKIKQEDYVRLHRIVTGLSERTVWEHMSEGKRLDDLLAPLPDELHQWTRDVWRDLSNAADIIECRARDAHTVAIDALPADWTRRQYAEVATKQKGSLTPLMFQLLDGRDPRPSILRTLKPAGDTRARAISEAVA